MQGKHNDTTQEFLAAMSEQAERWKELDFDEMLGRYKEASETLTIINFQLLEYGLEVTRPRNAEGDFVYGISVRHKTTVFASKMHK